MPERLLRAQGRDVQQGRFLMQEIKARKGPIIAIVTEGASCRPGLPTR
jgi:hypothetical protein